ncbi:MAG: AraC family transcriptional regulator [Alistipes sp.]|uniref:helix-turn-helix transcriptional regulator n=1 Tax=Alistipes sp. TaxID=1872444 RepID=UPI0025BA76F8|nr:AraC family transcriptional regulator [Alistipes sp.]MCD8276307.1 AraC family transcriptional regulator [Alistipes sp.]
MIQKHKLLLCDEHPSDCSFEMKNYSAGATVHNEDTNTNYLIFCLAGHARITGTLFHDEILCAGEVMFVPRGSECSGTALSDVTLLVHKFNNTVCQHEKCILAYLYSHRHVRSKIYCCKLTVPKSLQILISGIISYLTDEMHDNYLWKLKHKELIWGFTRYYDAEELQSFFHPMTDEQVPFRNLVLTHYRKANNTEELAELCGYGVHTFRRIFKNEFGVSVYRWLIQKRAEHIKYRLSMSYIPLSDIINEFNFSSAQHFNSFCKQYLGDTPGNLRKENDTSTK